MDETAKYTLGYYEQQNEAHPRDVYIVLTYDDDWSNVVNIDVYSERYIAEKYALDITGASRIVNAAKEVSALSYAIGERLMAEIHEKTLL